MYQDNKSSILLEENGRASSGKRTRHMNVRYFFIADRVKSKEIVIEYCPTGLMVGDYFTKSLQGQLFIDMRNWVMGNKPIPLPSDPSPGMMSKSSPDDPSLGTTDKTIQTEEFPEPQVSQQIQSVLNNSDCDSSSDVRQQTSRQPVKSARQPNSEPNGHVSNTVSWASVAKGGIEKAIHSRGTVAKENSNVRRNRDG